MNVLYYRLPSSNLGGVANVALNLSKTLARKVNLSYFPPSIFRKGDLANSLNIYGKFAAKGFDVVHFNVVPAWANGSFLMLEFAKRHGAHTVLNIHDIIQLEHRLEPALGPVSPLELSDALKSCRIADRIVVNSDYMRCKVVDWYGADYNKVVVIPNGIDLSLFSGQIKGQKLDGEPALLYLGRLSKRKGVDVLICAMVKVRLKLPRARLHIVGYGRISDFQLLAREKGVESAVVFHGEAPGSMIYDYYCSADICVFPSRHEGFGIVILEAMASGKPIVASNIGSFREILCEGKNGLMFESGDADALSRAIITLGQDSRLRENLPRAASEAVKKYSWEKIAEEYVSLYRCLCK